MKKNLNVIYNICSDIESNSGKGEDYGKWSKKQTYRKVLATLSVNINYHIDELYGILNGKLVLRIKYVYSKDFNLNETPI